MVDVLLGTEFQSSPWTNPGKRKGAEFVSLITQCYREHHQHPPTISPNFVSPWCIASNIFRTTSLSTSCCSNPHLLLQVWEHHLFQRRQVRQVASLKHHFGKKGIWQTYEYTYIYIHYTYTGHIHTYTYTYIYIYMHDAHIIYIYIYINSETGRTITTTWTTICDCDLLHQLPPPMNSEQLLVISDHPGKTPTKLLMSADSSSKTATNRFKKHPGK